MFLSIGSSCQWQHLEGCLWGLGWGKAELLSLENGDDVFFFVLVFFLVMTFWRYRGGNIFPFFPASFFGCSELN